MSNIAALEAALPKLSLNDRSFANSMLNYARKKGTFSPGQMPYVDKLIARANAPAPTPVDVGALSGIMTLFDRAREHLKFPAIVLAIPGHDAVRLSVAGPSSKFPGTINVTGQERNPATGRRPWRGRIRAVGSYEPDNTTAGTPEGRAIVNQLTRFAASPAEVAQESAKLTGRCCFCNITLTDKRSTDVGYGKICSEHYGLPWGN